MTRDRTDPLLLTPGPLTTTATVKAAMLRDWGSRDPAFIALNRHIRERLVHLAGAGGSHVTVPIQGSGTFAVEAMLGTFVPPGGSVAVLVNGAYGRRMAAICHAIGRRAVTLETDETEPADPAALAALLAANSDIGHVAMVHCETTTGILNPLPEFGGGVAAAGRRLLVDAMSAFGALPVDPATAPFDALAASANKCLQGVPGVAFVLCREAALRKTAGQAPSVSLDLHAQWQAMEHDGQWRFTPPTQVLAALDRALDELDAEGGVAARGARYARNCAVLVAGMRRLGFEPLLPEALQAPVIVTFHMPAHPGFVFARFYELLREQGFVIYPGKLTDRDSFRIGCIGALDESDIRTALDAVAAALARMANIPAADRHPADGE